MRSRSLRSCGRLASPRQPTQPNHHQPSWHHLYQQQQRHIQLRQYHRPLVERAQRAGRESWALVKTLLSQLQQQPKADWRAACLQLTQQDDNRLAKTLLQLDKELHLIRYHGWQNYYRQHVLPAANATSSNSRSSSFWVPWLRPYLSSSSSSNRAAENKPQQASISTSSRVMAKIPFVITTAMKEDLADLGYAPPQLKRLTPLQATLLLQHGVAPQECEERLPVLQQEFEQAQERRHAAEQAKLQREQQEEKKLAAQQEEAARAPQQVEPVASAADAPISASPALPPTTSTTKKRTGTAWYRVVEVVHPHDGDEQEGDTVDVAVGLHKTLEEAEQDCALRQELADRNQQKKTTTRQRRHFKIVHPNDDLETTTTTPNSQEGGRSSPQTTAVAVPKSSSKTE